MATTNGNACSDPCCYDPMEMFTVAAALSVLLYQNLSLCQMNTIINLLTLIIGNLTAFVTQIELNQGETLDPPF